jgi:hypothetical protein
MGKITLMTIGTVIESVTMMRIFAISSRPMPLNHFIVSLLEDKPSPHPRRVPELPQLYTNPLLAIHSQSYEALVDE